MAAGPDTGAVRAPDAEGPPTRVVDPPVEAPKSSRWLARFLVLLTLAALVLLAAPGMKILPYVLDDFALDGIVRLAALDWRDFGESKGRERLTFEIDRGEIGAWVPDTACAFGEGEAGVRRISCAWHVDVWLPVLEQALPLDFSSEASISANGDVY